MSTETSHIRTCLEGRVLRIELNRPEKKNALTQEMYAALADAFAAADKDPQVRCVLLHGAGDCFTSGNDLKDFVNPEGIRISFQLRVCVMEKERSNVLKI